MTMKSLFMFYMVMLFVSFSVIHSNHALELVHDERGAIQGRALIPRLNYTITPNRKLLLVPDIGDGDGDGTGNFGDVGGGDGTGNYGNVGGGVGDVSGGNDGNVGIGDVSGGNDGNVGGGVGDVSGGNDGNVGGGVGDVSGGNDGNVGGGVGDLSGGNDGNVGGGVGDLSGGNDGNVGGGVGDLSGGNDGNVGGGVGDVSGGNDGNVGGSVGDVSGGNDGTGGDGSDNRVGEGSCSKESIHVNQGVSDPLPSGIPTFTVIVENLCYSGSCSISNIHLSCGWFSSARLINPKIFRRLNYNDCLVNDGQPLTPGQSLTFAYANSHKYPLDVSSVQC